MGEASKGGPQPPVSHGGGACPRRHSPINMRHKKPAALARQPIWKHKAGPGEGPPSCPCATSPGPATFACCGARGGCFSRARGPIQRGPCPCPLEGTGAALQAAPSVVPGRLGRGRAFPCRGFALVQLQRAALETPAGGCVGLRPRGHGALSSCRPGTGSLVRLPRLSRPGANPGHSAREAGAQREPFGAGSPERLQTVGPGSPAGRGLARLGRGQVGSEFPARPGSSLVPPRSPVALRPASCCPCSSTPPE